jgi:hypothetical protein
MIADQNPSLSLFWLNGGDYTGSPRIVEPREEIFLI